MQIYQKYWKSKNPELIDNERERDLSYPNLYIYPCKFRLKELVYCGMERKKGSILLVLRGMDGRAWDINYFSIISYSESGEDTLLHLNGHLCDGESRLLVNISLPAFESLYNQAKEHIEKLQTITQEALLNIENNHQQYFEKSKTSIWEYIKVYWTDPVQIEFSQEKELPIGIRHHLEQTFRIAELE